MRERDDIEIEIEDRPSSSDATATGRDEPTGEATASRREGRTNDATGRRRKRPATDAPSRHRDSALADELGRVDVMTTPEGYVEATVSDVVDVDERTVRLTVRLPHGAETSFDLEKPIPWSDEYRLARIVEDVGYDAASIDHVVGESVYLERVAGDDPGSVSWWAASARDLGRASIARLAERYGLRVSNTGEWRLVDPRERENATASERRRNRTEGIAIVAAFLGAVLAVIGAVAAGSTAATTVVGAALPGLAVLAVALFVLRSD